MAEAILRKAKRISAEALKKQTQEGLAKIFSELSCKGVAKEIKAGRNVVGNVEYGLRLCIHDKLGPRVNVETRKFIPMTDRDKEIEEQMVKLMNKALENGGFRKVSPTLIPTLRKKDEEFKQRVESRR